MVNLCCLSPLCSFFNFNKLINDLYRVKDVAVMRRKNDDWLNVTQILKVANFDKPHRTRILERDVQRGEHEKVQGGYGKYQGYMFT